MRGEVYFQSEQTSGLITQTSAYFEKVSKTLQGFVDYVQYTRRAVDMIDTIALPYKLSVSKSPGYELSEAIVHLTGVMQHYEDGAKFVDPMLRISRMCKALAKLDAMEQIHISLIKRFIRENSRGILRDSKMLQYIHFGLYKKGIDIPRQYTRKIGVEEIDRKVWDYKRSTEKPVYDAMTVYDAKDTCLPVLEEWDGVPSVGPDPSQDRGAFDSPPSEKEGDEDWTDKVMNFWG